MRGGFLRLKDFGGDGCAKHCPSRPLENPDSCSGRCRSDPGIGKGRISSRGGGGGGLGKDSREIAALGKGAISALLHAGGAEI